MDADLLIHYSSLLSGSSLAIQPSILDPVMKGMFLTKGGLAGEELLVEKPIVSWQQHAASIPTGSLSPSMIFACSFCFKQQATPPVTCIDCGDNVAVSCDHKYCSTTCRDIHFKLGHAALCPWHNPKHAKTISRLLSMAPPHSPVSAYTVAEVLAYIICTEGVHLLQAEDEAVALQYAFVPFARFFGSNNIDCNEFDVQEAWRLTSQVLSDFDRIYLSIFQHVSLQGKFLLSKHTLLSEEMFRYILSVLCMNSMAIEVNGNALGSCLMTCISCLNHSCDPNAEVVFTDSSEATLRLLKDVRKGEELFISYINCDGLDVWQRRERLSEWGFTCACPRCADEDPQGKLTTIE